MKLLKKISSKTPKQWACTIFRVTKRKVCRLLDDCCYHICRCLPINSKIIVFQTEGDFCDNGRALYEYLIRRKVKSHKYIWFVSDVSLFKGNDDTKFLCPWGDTIHFRVMYYLAVSKNVIETHNLTNRKLRKRQNYISLWHGMALKANKGALSYSKPVFDYVIHLGKGTEKSQAQFMHCDLSYFLHLGYPRNDVLLNNSSDSKNNPLLKGKKYNKVVIWMPTFRASFNSSLSEDGCDTETGLPLLMTKQDLIEMDQNLKRYGVCLVVKIHHLQSDNPIFKILFDNIVFVEDGLLLQKNIQLYELVAQTDALLSDYSSVFADYLLLDKPMGFVLSDMDLYQKSRGFVVDNVLDYLAGHHIYCKEDLYGFIDDVVNENDLFREDRLRLIPKIHDYPDNKSCERIANYFEL